MKKALYFIIFLFTVHIHSTAAVASYCYGTVVDETGEPLPGATIAILQNERSHPNTPVLNVQSDIDGYFRVTNCADFITDNGGTAYLRVTYIGYVPYEQYITDYSQEISAILYEDLATDDNIQCSDNQYREYDFSANASTCETCPTHNNIAAIHLNNDSGNPYYNIYNCYIPFGTTWTFSDSTGSGTETFKSGSCYYN